MRKNTVWRWEHEERRIPETVVRLVHYLAKEVEEEHKSKKRRRPQRRQAKEMLPP